ncbi:MAG: T9SS type A sorting domain-containing protein [Ignavibacteria bacterium]|nr:T9SS type A sorting domain-containing protein [Ignavibacteria bacterium]
MSNIVVYSLACRGNSIFAGSTWGSGIFLSTNNGTNWTQTSLINQSVRVIAVNENYIFAGTLGNGIYSSSNNGTNWNQTSIGMYNEISSLVTEGSNIVSGFRHAAPPYGLYLVTSTNNCQTWAATGLSSHNVLALVLNGSNIFAGTTGGVYFSTNFGGNWIQSPLRENTFSLAQNGNFIYAGTSNNGIYMSTNYGTNWNQTLFNNRFIYSLICNGDNVFAGTCGNGVYISNDNGSSWTQRNEGLGNDTIYSLCIVSDYIFAGTKSKGVYRRMLSELIGINPISIEIPLNFSLSQNYPNPFNPATKIQFALPNSSDTKLIIYDAIGKEVETLVNESLEAGIYEVSWYAEKFSSGIYFYQLTTDIHTDTKKMILVK